MGRKESAGERGSRGIRGGGRRSEGDRRRRKREEMVVGEKVRVRRGMREGERAIRGDSE